MTLNALKYNDSTLLGLKGLMKSRTNDDDNDNDDDDDDDEDDVILGSCPSLVCAYLRQTLQDCL